MCSPIYVDHNDLTLAKLKKEKTEILLIFVILYLFLIFKIDTNLKNWFKTFKKKNKNKKNRFCSFNNWILHLTARTCDSHAVPTKKFSFLFYYKWWNFLIILVKFLADYRIKPHAPPFIQIPANLFSFMLCNCTHQVNCLRVN